MLLSDLAVALDCSLTGDGTLEIGGIAGLESATPSDLSFVTDPRYAAAAQATRAGALLVPLEFPAVPQPTLRSAEPHVLYARAVALLRPPWRPAPGIHPSAVIDASAQLGPEAFVGPLAVIGAGCRVGARAVIHAHAVLYPGVQAGDDLLVHSHAVLREGTQLGHRVILQPGVVLGGDGYGFAKRRDGSYEKIPQVGHVELGDDVEVQANSCIDRASLHATVIGSGTKVDNLAHVAHNCRLQDNVLLCAQVGLAGSTTIEADVTLAGQVGVAGHCTIGRGAIVTAQSGTHGDLPGGHMYSGSPAFAHEQWLRSSALYPRLATLYRTVQTLKRALEKHLGAPLA